MFHSTNILLPDKYPKGILTCEYQRPKSILANILAIMKTWKEAVCLPEVEQINKLWHWHTANKMFHRN